MIHLIFLSPIGAETLVAITPKLINTTNYAISHFDSNERNCYAKNEFILDTFNTENGYRYSMNNCRYESLLQKTMANCSCLPSFAKDAEYKLPKCMGISLKCYWEVYKGFDDMHTAFEGDEKVEKKCQPNCEEFSFETSVSSSVYPNNIPFMARKDFCFIFRVGTYSCQILSKKQNKEL